jgi:hypothetical protein
MAFELGLSHASKEKKQSDKEAGTNHYALDFNVCENKNEVATSILRRCSLT